MFLKKQTNPAQYNDALELYRKTMSSPEYNNLTREEQLKKISPIIDLIVESGFDPREIRGERAYQEANETIDYLGEKVKAAVNEIDHLKLSMAIADEQEKDFSDPDRPLTGIGYHFYSSHKNPDGTFKEKAFGAMTNGSIVALLSRLINHDDGAASIILSIGARLLFAKIFGPSFSADGLAADYENAPSIMNQFFTLGKEDSARERFGPAENMLAAMLFVLAHDLHIRPMNTSDKDFRNDPDKFSRAILGRARVTTLDAFINYYAAINEIDLPGMSSEEMSEFYTLVCSRFTDIKVPDGIDKMISKLTKK